MFRDLKYLDDRPLVMMGSKRHFSDDSTLLGHRFCTLSFTLRFTGDASSWSSPMPNLTVHVVLTSTWRKRVALPSNLSNDLCVRVHRVFVFYRISRTSLDVCRTKINRVYATVRQNGGLHATLSNTCTYVRFNEIKATKPHSFCSAHRFTDNREFEILARFSSHEIYIFE